MKALITGGAGFIGSHLAEKLLKENWTVSIIDDLSTGSEENLKHIIDEPELKFVQGDINDETVLDKLICDCDCIFHLAAAVGVRLIAEQPVKTIETNIGGTETVLDLANKYAKKILIASSSEVYGKTESVPFKEDDDLVLGSTTVSRWSYACSKAIDEFLGLAFYNEYELPVIIARFFNTIGPRQTGDYGMVVPRFVKRALNDQPVEIYGTGKQTRCFTDVDDVVKAVFSLVNSDKTAGQVFNIGSENEISIEDLADKVIKITNSKSEKKHISYEEAYSRLIEDMKRRVPSIEKIKNAVNWQPEITLEQSINKIIGFYK